MTAKYEDPRAHAVRERYLGLFGGPELPVPVEAIAGDLLGLRVEESWDIDCSGMLLPAERRIVLNARERAGGRDDPPLRRFRFTIAHEIGHWVCHCLEGRAPSPAPVVLPPGRPDGSRRPDARARGERLRRGAPDAGASGAAGVGGAGGRGRVRREVRREPDRDAVAALQLRTYRGGSRVTRRSETVHLEFASEQEFLKHAAHCLRQMREGVVPPSEAAA